MKEETRQLKIKAEQARSLYRIGEISYSEAISSIKPYIDKVNIKSKELAKKNYKNSWLFENNILKKYITLQRFNKAIDCITFLKSKENEKISFDGRSYRSSIIRILW